MKKSVCAILVFLCLCLTACGQRQEEILREDGQKGETIPKQTETETETDREINWIIEEQELPDADEAIMDVISSDSIIWFDDWYLRDGTVYRVVTCANRDETVPDSEFYKGWYIQKLVEPYEEWVNYFIEPADWVEDDVCKSLRSGSYIMTEDRFYILLEGAQGNYIGEWTEEGGPSAKKIESDIFVEEFSQGSAASWWRGQDGSYYLYGEDEYIYMDDGFNVKERLGSDDGYRFYSVQENPESGRVYLFCAAESSYVAEYSSYVDSGVKILDQKEKKVLLESAETDGNYGGIVSFTSEEEGYCYGSYSIAGFSLQTGELESIYDFEDDRSYFDKMYNSKKPLMYMHIRNGIVDANAGEDGSHALLVACSDGAYRIWKMYQGEEQTVSSNKQKLELAITVPDAFINRAVYEFNRQSEEYKVVLRTPDEGEDFEDFRTRIQAELAAGGGPDILMAGSVIDMEAGAKKGFLTDLSDAFAGYETDVLPAAWEVGLVNGYRYGVPYSCTINTLVTDKRLVDNQSCWTLDEAMQYMEESGAEYFIAGAGEAELFFNLGILTGTNGQLIDWQNKTSYLNKDAAVRLLEFSGRYADHECEAGGEFVEAASGKAMTAILYVGSPVEMQAAAAMFESNEAYIGFPTENGASGHIMAVSNLVINRKSSCQEGAIAFLEFLLSSEMQEGKAKELIEGSGHEYGFPVRKSAMDLVYDSLRENKEMPGGVYGGIELEEWTLSDESIEKLKDMIETAMPRQEKADEVMDIVVEEIKSFREEGKSAQQTLDIVNSRVQLYLNEIED